MIPRFIFADDTVIYYAHKNIEDATKAIQQDLQEIDHLMDSNKLIINSRRTQCMIVSGHHKKLENIDIRIIDYFQNQIIPNLGVKIDQNLNYSQHINNLAETVKNKIRSITIISHFLPKGIVMTLQIPYNSTFSASTSLLDDLQNIQSKAFAKLLKQKDLVFVLNHEFYLIEEPKTVNHDHNTRNNNALYLSKPNTNYLNRTVTMEFYNSPFTRI